MHLAQQKTQLESVEGLFKQKEENVQLKHDLAAMKEELNLSFSQMNQYMSERNSALHTVEFQIGELKKKGKELKQL